MKQLTIFVVLFQFSWKSNKVASRNKRIMPKSKGGGLAFVTAFWDNHIFFWYHFFQEKVVKIAAVVKTIVSNR